MTRNAILDVAKVICKAHALDLLEAIQKNKVVSSSELILLSHIQPPQAYRALEELASAGLVTREKKNPEGGKPYVFWHITDRGKTTLEFVKRFSKELE